MSLGLVKRCLALVLVVVGCGGATHTKPPDAAPAPKVDVVALKDAMPTPQGSGVVTAFAPTRDSREAAKKSDRPAAAPPAPAKEEAVGMEDTSSLGSLAGSAETDSLGIGGLGIRGTGKGGGGGGSYGSGIGTGRGAAGSVSKAAPKRTFVEGDAPMASVEAPSLKAGRHDDNKEYNRFLKFLNDYAQYVVLPVDVSERLVVRAVDQNGKSLPNCAVAFSEAGGKALTRATTFADGKVQFFPSAHSSAGAKDFVAKVICTKGKTTLEKNTQLARTGRREMEVRFDFAREVAARVPVDVAIVFDSTGSMQSQIDRLKKTVRAIHFQLTQLSTKPDIRFALVDYRDQGDNFVTRVTPFTNDVGVYQAAVDAMEADGGGDTPEDLQSGLADAFKLGWRDQALRLGFTITDAVPHTDYGQQFDYRTAMQEGLERGIKWTTIGVGGLGTDGEVIFRQIAQYTMGEYVFVTESQSHADSGGSTGEASHHVGANYTKENLDQAIVRIVRRELSYLTDSPSDFDDTIVATGKGGKDLLKPAVEEVMRQLADYSALKLVAGTPLAVVPVTADTKHKDVGGYLTDQFILSASRNPSFRLVDRDLSAVAQEIKLQLTDLFDVTQAVPIGQMIGADALVVAKLVVNKDGAELYAKLVRVATGEVLSVARVNIGVGVIAGS